MPYLRMGVRERLLLQCAWYSCVSIHKLVHSYIFKLVVLSAFTKLFVNFAWGNYPQFIAL